VEWSRFERPAWLQSEPIRDPVHFDFTTDGQAIVLVTKSRFARWSTATGKLLETTTLNIPGDALQLSPDGSKIAVLNHNVVSIWDPCAGASTATDWEPSIRSSRFIAKDRILSRGEDRSLHWWDPTQGRRFKMLSFRVDNAMISPNGRWWAMFTEQALAIGDVAGKKETHRLRQQGAHVCFAFSDDGNELLTVDSGGTWQFWNLERGTSNRSFTAVVTSRVEYTPDNRSVAAYVDKTGAVAIYDAQTGKRRVLTEPIATKTDSPVSAFCFSPSGQYLVLVHGMRLSVLSTIYGRVVLRQHLLNRPTSQDAVTFSPDERWLILGHGLSSELYLYDLDAACLSDDESRTIEAHPGGVTGLHLSRDKKYIVSTGNDGVSLVWDTKKLFPSGAVLAGPKEPNPDDWWVGLREKAENDLSHLMVRMIHCPDKTVPLLAKRLGPVREPDAKMLSQWIKHLDSQQFREREEAMKTLAELGELMEPALRAALKQPVTVEFKLRAQQLLQKLDQPESQPDRLRQLRAIEILERIGTAEARVVLTRLSTGVAAARQTVEAAEVLKRLSRRGS
jgi:WD40 repeat protein